MADSVEYQTPDRGGAKCPTCGADTVKVEQTVYRTKHATVRWHRCACGVRFKSVESVDYSDANAQYDPRKLS